MERNLNNLSEFDLQDFAYSPYDILVGCKCHKKVYHNGLMNDVYLIWDEPVYEVEYIGGSILDTVGLLCKSVFVEVDTFKEIFGDIENFMNEWAFRLVLLGVDICSKGELTFMFDCVKIDEHNDVWSKHRKVGD